jgi:MFS superfamily sulfate permease-like transporter
LLSGLVSVELSFSNDTNRGQTTAVGLLLVDEVITRTQTERQGEYTAEDIAKALSLLSGFVLMFLGLCRLGWLTELVPCILAWPTCTGIP